MAPRYYSSMNCGTITRHKDYKEYIEYAGKSGLVAAYDEDSGTINLLFTETPDFHRIGKDATCIEDNGIAKFGVIFQTPEQLRLMAKKIGLFAEAMEHMQDPNYRYTDILMGRKVSSDYEKDQKSIA